MGKKLILFIFITLFVAPFFKSLPVFAVDSSSSAFGSEDVSQTEASTCRSSQILKQRLNCGFAGEKGKDACCLQNPDAFIQQINLQSLQTQIEACGGQNIVDNSFTKILTALVIKNIISDQEVQNLSELIKENKEVVPRCIVGVPQETSDPVVTEVASCICKPEGSAAVCDKYFDASKNGPERQKCFDCMSNNNQNVKKIYTVLGCIDATPIGLVNAFFSFGLGLAGILAILCIIYAAFLMQTSRGNPEKVKKAQELLTSCISGLILIIFSIFILRVIGVDILRIPGFTR